MSIEQDRQDELIRASAALAPWMSAALCDRDGCAQFKEAATEFLHVIYAIQHSKD